MHGAKRVIIFCLMTAILPTVFIVTPLYLRHSVFADLAYPVSESDVLAIVDGVSSVFCESHSLKMNSTFNAFQLKGTPQISEKRKHIRLKKSMSLPDDTLEYWGFFLMKGAVVKLKVCSRYDGSRILVVRGEKNLRTCGLMEHNLKKSGAKMDQDHSQVKVTFENAAEELGVVDDDTLKDTAAEEMSGEEVNSYVKNRINKGRERLNKLNTTFYSSSTTNKPETQQNTTENIRKMRREKLEKLREMLREEEEKMAVENGDDNTKQKRDLAAYDAHIKHGGNAIRLNLSYVSDEESSVSSFETDLLTCYDGQILLTQGFSPSTQCKDVHHLEKSTNHMQTLHEVVTDGYYYYIFYSDNDFVKNDIHAVFDIYKPTYRFANTSKGDDCLNKTECNFPLSFLADETVIVEVPTIDGIEHEADDNRLLISRCHPRMTVYMIFPILVLFLILGCAFL